MRDCNRGQARAEIDSGWLERDLARETRRLEVRQPLGSRVGGVLGVRSAVRQGVACSRGLRPAGRPQRGRGLCPAELHPELSSRPQAPALKRSDLPPPPVPLPDGGGVSLGRRPQSPWQPEYMGTAVKVTVPTNFSVSVEVSKIATA